MELVLLDFFNREFGGRSRRLFKERVRKFDVTFTNEKKKEEIKICYWHRWNFENCNKKSTQASFGESTFDEVHYFN